jgi:hypothetical protein
MFPRPALPPNASLAQRLSAVVMGVVVALGERTRRVPHGARVHHLVPQPVYDRILAWLRARRLRIEALIDRIRAGTLRQPRAHAPRPDAAGVAPEGVAPRPRGMVPPQDRIPALFGWVCHWAPEAGFAGQDLSLLLEDAEMKALVLAAPGPMARLWTPLLNALGRPKPEWFPKPPKRRRRARTPRPPCGGGSGWGMEDAGSRGVRSAEGSCGGTPPPTPSHRERGLLDPPPLPAVPPPPCPLPPRPLPTAAVWTGLGPGPCATLAEYRSPFQPGGDDNPPALPVSAEWQKSIFSRLRRS